MKKKLNHILLIDDDIPTNFLSKLIIEEGNFADKITTILYAEEALKFLKSNPTSLPELILLDLNMPGMDGWGFMEAYQSLNQNIRQNTVVVILSTSLNPDDKKRAAETDGVQAYLPKPLSESLLVQIMQLEIFNHRFSGTKEA